MRSEELRYRFAMIYNRQRLVERINAHVAVDPPENFRSTAVGPADRALPGGLDRLGILWYDIRG